MAKKTEASVIEVYAKAKKQCEDAITRGETEEALIVLLRPLQLKNIILQLQNRLSFLKEEKRKGIIEDSSFRIEHNKITNSTLEIINKLGQDQPISNNLPQKVTLIIIGGLLILFAGMYLKGYLDAEKISKIQTLNVRVLYFDDQYISNDTSRLGIKYSGEVLDALAKRKIEATQNKGTEFYQKERWDLHPVRGGPLRNDTLEAKFEEYVKNIVPCVIIYGYFYELGSDQIIEVTIRGSYYKTKNDKGNLFFSETAFFDNNLNGIKKSSYEMAEKIYTALMSMDHLNETDLKFYEP